MIKVMSHSRYGRSGLSALAGLALFLQAPLATAQSLMVGQTTEHVVAERPEQLIPLEQRAKTNYDAYILGPGDGLEVELVDLPELSGQFSIGPDGTLYLPRLRAQYVEGLTVDELQAFLTEQFRAFLLNTSDAADDIGQV